MGSFPPAQCATCSTAKKFPIGLFCLYPATRCSCWFGQLMRSLLSLCVQLVRIQIYNWIHNVKYQGFAFFCVKWSSVQCAITFIWSTVMPWFWWKLLLYICRRMSWGPYGSWSYMPSALIGDGVPRKAPRKLYAFWWMIGARRWTRGLAGTEWWMGKTMAVVWVRAIRLNHSIYHRCSNFGVAPKNCAQ